ncbi:hypothetical protein [Modestobacter altitudinis]|uniref:hypothetical protein n=1 Tax=Modestobacter altitudinis TaxID=2213158 RepID=UPI00110CDB23|nr:hypothetical protein [Modestobacter altitudinis]
MTQDAPGQLHLVTGNRVDHLPEETPHDGAVLADLLRRAEALDDRAARERAPRVAGPLLVGAALTVVLALLVRQPWQLPSRGVSGVADVPQSLLTFLLLAAAACVWAAGRWVRPAETLTSGGAAHLWWALVSGAALVSVAAALSLASYAGTGDRPADLVVRCAVPLVPAVLAGVLAAGAGRAARVRAALGTGLVTVPLGSLGWALLSSSARSTAGLADVLGMTALAAVAPLLLAVAFVAADRRGPQRR